MMNYRISVLLIAVVSSAFGAQNFPDRAPVAPVVPAMSCAEIAAGLESHDRALYIKQGWIRDPYIILGPDDTYYLTGTTPNPRNPREQSDPYNVGLGKSSIVGPRFSAFEPRWIPPQTWSSRTARH